MPLDDLEVHVLANPCLSLCIASGFRHSMSFLMLFGFKYGLRLNSSGLIQSPSFIKRKVSQRRSRPQFSFGLTFAPNNDGRNRHSEDRKVKLSPTLFTDINECTSPETNDCDSNAECSNAEGSYICSCNEGYTGDGRNCTGTVLHAWNLIRVISFYGKVILDVMVI